MEVHPIKVKEVMHKGVDWVSPDTPVTEIAKLMREHDIGAIPIGENDQLIRDQRTHPSGKGKAGNRSQGTENFGAAFFREPANAAVHEISFFFSPKVVKVAKYRSRYEALKTFLAEQGVDTAQPIATERVY